MTKIVSIDGEYHTCAHLFADLAETAGEMEYAIVVYRKGDDVFIRSTCDIPMAQMTYAAAMFNHAVNAALDEG